MGKHTEWRKLAKKARRKRVRQENAKFRANAVDEEQRRREKSPTYKQWLEEQRLQEEFQAKEEARLAKEAEEQYLKREEQAQKEWEELQERLALAKEERAKQIAKIKEEWEREQKRLREARERKEREEEEKQRRQELLQQRIEEFINSNAEMPDELNQVLESNPGKMVCPFFKKTAACRFNDSCSRNHIRPTISRVLLFRNFYSHYSLEQTSENEHGSDSMLEFESNEIYKHFKEFFYDVFYEMEKLGDIMQFKVCCNKEGHLRGNVYIEYGNFRQAIKSYRVFQGRWYGGKQLNVEFCNIESWKSAICGLFFRQRCPKGSVCNFLHVFRNPRNMFLNADRDLHRIPERNLERNSIREWRWSESPERLNSEENRGLSERSNRSTNRGEDYVSSTKTRNGRRKHESRERHRHNSRRSNSHDKSRSVKSKRRSRSRSREKCCNGHKDSPSRSHRSSKYDK